MAKKKKTVSSLELFLWKLAFFLLITMWVLTIVFTVFLTNKYGLDDIGVHAILYFLFLFVLSVTWITVYTLLIRLRLPGLKRVMGVSTLIITGIPLTVLLADFMAITNSGDTWLLAFPVALVLGFAILMLPKKTHP